MKYYFNSKYNKKSLWLSAILNMIFCPSVTPTESLIILPNKLIAIRCLYFQANVRLTVKKKKNIKKLNSNDLQTTINQDKVNKIRIFSSKLTMVKRCCTWNYSKSEKHLKLTHISRWCKRRSKQNESLIFYLFQNESKQISNLTHLSHLITILTTLVELFLRCKLLTQQTHLLTKIQTLAEAG